MQKNQKKCAANRLAGAPMRVSALLLAGLTACSAPESPAADAAGPAPVAYACGSEGYVKTSLYGAITTVIKWTHTDLECEGMPRPGGAGARLRFAGLQDDRPIAIIIALPDLERSATARELATTVTLIEEGTGRFFSNASAHHCLTDITSIEAVDSTDDRVAIAGTMYCILPLVQVNARPSVSMPKLEFRGLLDWNAS